MTTTDAGADAHVILGQVVHLPVQVRSATQASATWSVDADAAQAIVEGEHRAAWRESRSECGGAGICG